MRDKEQIDELRYQYEVGGRLKFLKDKDPTFRLLLNFLDQEYAKNTNLLEADEKVREYKHPGTFEPDNAIKGRIRMAKEFMGFINTMIQKGESALAELQDLEISIQK